MSELQQFIGYVGTYTKGKSEGIYSFILDTIEKKINVVNVAAKLDNPTYLTISKDAKHVFSVIKEADNGGVASFTVNLDGNLTRINHYVSEGAPPCHVNVDSKNQYVLSANYHKGTIECFELTKEGHIQKVASIINHNEEGIERKAHAHFVGFTPDEKYVIAVDLGLDKIISYSLQNGILTKEKSLSVESGSGPRHLVFHPKAPYAFVMTEFSSEIIVLKYDAEDGSFTKVQSFSTIPKDFKENNQGSAIHISSDGRYIYAANRGHNSIAVFSIEESTFSLHFVEFVSTEGNWPRDFALDSTEQFIVAANQESDNLVLFERDTISGKLTLLQSNIYVPTPVCVKFL